MEGLAKFSKLVQEAKKRKKKAKQVECSQHDTRPVEEESSKTRDKKIGKKHKISETKKKTGTTPIREGVTNNDPRADRTVFVGNAPTSLTKKQVMKFCRKYGKVECIRMRSAAVSPGKLPIKIARKLKKQLTGSTVNWYVVMATSDEAKQCLQLNGVQFDDRHLRVDMATPTKDNNRTVFIGNLPFDTDEEKLRNILGHCGEIEGIRIIKDNRTGIGKGIAYVLFKESSGVLFALKHNSRLELEGRKLRISRSKTSSGKTSEVKQPQSEFRGARTRSPKETWLPKQRQDGGIKKKRWLPRQTQDERLAKKNGEQENKMKM